MKSSYVIKSVTIEFTPEEHSALTELLHHMSRAGIKDYLAEGKDLETMMSLKDEFSKGLK